MSDDTPEPSPYLGAAGIHGRHGQDRAGAAISLDAEVMQMTLSLMERQSKENASLNSSAINPPKEEIMHTTPSGLEDAIPARTEYQRSSKDSLVNSGEDYMDIFRLQMMPQPHKASSAASSVSEDFMHLPRMMEAKDNFQRPGKETSDDVLQMIRMMEEVVKEPGSHNDKDVVSSSSTSSVLSLQQSGHPIYLPHNTPMMQMAGPVLDNSQPVEKSYMATSNNLVLPPMIHLISPLSKSATSMSHLPPVSTLTESKSVMGLVSKAVLPPTSHLTYTHHVEEHIPIKDYSAVTQQLMKDFPSASVPSLKDYSALAPVKDFGHLHTSLTGMRDYAQSLHTKEYTHTPHSISKPYNPADHDTAKDYTVSSHLNNKSYRTPSDLSGREYNIPCLSASKLYIQGSHECSKDYGHSVIKDYTPPLPMPSIEAALGRENSSKDFSDTDRYMLQAGLLTHTGIPSTSGSTNINSTPTLEQASQHTAAIARQIAQESLQFHPDMNSGEQISSACAIHVPGNADLIKDEGLKMLGPSGKSVYSQSPRRQSFDLFVPTLSTQESEDTQENQPMPETGFHPGDTRNKHPHSHLLHGNIHIQLNSSHKNELVNSQSEDAQHLMPSIHQNEALTLANDVISSHILKDQEETSDTSPQKMSELKVSRATPPNKDDKDFHASKYSRAERRSARAGLGESEVNSSSRFLRSEQHSNTEGSHLCSAVIVSSAVSRPLNDDTSNIPGIPTEPKIIIDDSPRNVDTPVSFPCSAEGEDYRFISKKGYDRIPGLVDGSNCGRLHSMQLQRRGIDNRSIHQHWFISFPWLQLDTTTCLFTCKTCLQADVSGSPYFHGSPAQNSKKSNFEAHETSAAHKEACGMLEMATPATIERYHDSSGNKDQAPGVLSGGARDNQCTDSYLPRRNIRQEWFTKFPWLKMEEKKHKFFCELCIKHQQVSIFTLGKPAVNPKKDNFMKHEETEGHKVSLLMERGLTLEAAKSTVGLNHATDLSTGTIDNLNAIDATDASIPGHVTDTRSLSRSTPNPQEDGDLQLSAKTFFKFFKNLTISPAPQLDLSCFSRWLWLEIDPVKEEFCCKICRCFNSKSTFAKELEMVNLVLEQLDKHEQSREHEEAVEVYRSGEPCARDLSAKHLADIARLLLYSQVLKESAEPSVAVLQYPWLKYDVPSCWFYCAICYAKESEQNCYISGDLLTSDHLKLHAQSEFHIASVGKLQTDIRSEISSGQNAPSWPDAFWRCAAELRQQGQLCDVNLVVLDDQGQQTAVFKAHKLILVAASCYFKTALQEGTLHSQFAVHNVTEPGLEGVLNFLYGEESCLSPSCYDEALAAATELNILPAEQYFRQLLQVCTNQAVLSLPKIPETVARLKKIYDPLEITACTGDSQTMDVNQQQWTLILNRNLSCPARGFKRTSANRQHGKPPRKKMLTEDKLNLIPCVKMHVARKKKVSYVLQSDCKNLTLATEETGVNTDEIDNGNESDLNSRSQMTEQKVCEKHVKKYQIPRHEYAAERKQKLANSLPSCDICNKTFLRKGCIKRHKELHHSSQETRSKFPCNNCPKVCPSKHDLKLHQRLHTGERPFSCDTCGKAFTRKETLIEHEYTHKPDEEKPHQCPVCGKGFFKLHDLQRHKTGLHSGARPFQCHVCGKAFPWARSLQDHLAAHQGPARLRPFKCLDCDMTFVRRYDLNRHAITHTKQKPFICEWCGHSYTQKGSMDKHKRDFCRSRPSKKKGQ